MVATRMLRGLVLATACVLFGAAQSASAAHFSDSFWATIPVGTTIVHDARGDERVVFALHEPVANCSAGNGTASHCRFLAASHTINVATEIGSVSDFLKSVSDGEVDVVKIGSQLRELDFRAFSPAVLKAKTSDEDEVKAQVAANKAVVTSVVAGLKRLPLILDRAQRINSLEDTVSAVMTAWNGLSGDKVTGCGTYRGTFQQHLALVAAFDFAFDKDEDNKVLKQCVKIIVVSMAALTEMRQLCDAFGAVDPANDIKLIYDVLIRAAKAQKAPTDDLDAAKGSVNASADSFKDGSTTFKNQMGDLLKSKDDLHDAVADVYKSDAWRLAVSGNSAAADASTVLTASILTRHDQFSDQLTNLEGDIKSTANERLSQIGKVDSKIDELHQKKMGQIDSMSGKFQGQHDQRMGRLTGIDNKVQGITSQAKSGFSMVQGKLDTLQTNLGRVIDGVSDIVKNDAALTTQELKQSLAQAFQQTQSKIGSIDDKLDAQAAGVQDALMQTRMQLQQSYEQTTSVLAGASQQMSATVVSAFEVIRTAVVDAARQTQDIVSSRVIANGARLSEQLVEFDKKIEYIDGRLTVLAGEVATLEDKLMVTNAILQDLAASAEVVAVGIEDMIGEIKEIFFQSTFQDLTDRYSSLRGSYTDVLASPDNAETMSALKLSCQQARANDLFLSFLNLVDIEDEQIPTQLEAFQFDATKYELFGMQVITVLDEVSMLATLCSGLLYRDDMTEDELRRKATDHARLIRHAAQQFTRHVDEVVPAYMIHQHVRDELEKASVQELGGDAATRAQRVSAIQTRLQTSAGAFAQITVLAAPRGGTIKVTHLEEQYPDVDLSNIRRFGMMVSANKAMAVFWGTTLQLPPSEPLDQEALLRQGIYRGNLTTDAGCTVAQDARFYPKCGNCVCDHFEDFASTKSASAGRVVTIFNSTSIDSDFAISSVFDAHVDYFMEQIRLDVALDEPALAAIKAETLDKQRQRQQRVLWEGYAENGKFHVVPGDVKGTILTQNEMTLTLNYGSHAFRRIVPLFCNSKPQQVQYNTTATVTYQCREVVRKSLGDGTEAYVARGTPTTRLDAAVCVETATTTGKMDCRVSGGFDSISGDVTALHVGRFVRDLTVYAGQARSGDFAVCKGCEGNALLASAGLSGVQSVAMETPNEAVLPYTAARCEKITDTIMVCKT